MKYIFLFFLLLILLHHGGFSQRADKEIADSMHALLPNATDDSAKVKLYEEIMLAHVYYKPEKGLTFTTPALELANKLNWKPGVARIKHRTGRLYWRLGNFEEALKNHWEALELYKQTGNKYQEGRVLIEIGQDFFDNGKLAEAKTALLKALQFNEALGYMDNMAKAYDIINYLYNV